MASSGVLGSGLQRGPVETPEPIQLWEQQPGEGPRAYAAFLEYRDIPSDRSYTEVARRVKKSVNIVARWGRVWHWQHRINAWVRHQENEKQAAILRSITETNDRHTAISRLLQQKIVERLRAMKAEEIEAKDIPKWLSVAVEVERMALGLREQDHEHHRDSANRYNAARRRHAYGCHARAGPGGPRLGSHAWPEVRSVAEA